MMASELAYETSAMSGAFRLDWFFDCIRRSGSMPNHFLFCPDLLHQKTPLVAYCVGRFPNDFTAVEDAVTVEPVGNFTLKGIGRPMAAYKVLSAVSSKN
jgi:hypothetical protein